MVFGEKMMKRNRTSKGMKMLRIGEWAKIGNSWKGGRKIKLKLQ